MCISYLNFKLLYPIDTEFKNKMRYIMSFLILFHFLLKILYIYIPINDQIIYYVSSLIKYGIKCIILSFILSQPISSQLNIT